MSVEYRPQARKVRSYTTVVSDESVYQYPKGERGKPRPRNPIGSYTVRKAQYKRSDRVVEGVMASCGRWSAWGVDPVAALNALRALCTVFGVAL